MALAVWQSTIVNRSGDVQPNAQVEVRLESSGALAAIYADRDGNIPLDNPFNADENGFARFYAAGGAYKITASLGSFSQTYRHVAIGLLGEQDQLSGNVAVDGTLTIHEGGDALTLKSDKPGHHGLVYMQFYADTGNPNTRSAYFGFASAGTSRISLVNEMAGDIYFQTGGQIIFQAPRIAVQGRGGVLHYGDTFTNARVFVRQGGSPVGFLEGDITIIW